MLAGQRSIRYLVPDLGKAPTRSESSRGRRNACFQFFTLVFIYARIYLFFHLLFVVWIWHPLWFFFLSSLLITSLGHIKLTDFGLSKIGLMNSKYSFSICFHSTVSCFQGFIWNPFDPESFVPHISLHILHTVLYTSLKVLIKRIWVTIKSLLNSRSFPLFSWPLCLIQGWYFKEKLDASHSKGSKG